MFILPDTVVWLPKSNYISVEIFNLLFKICKRFLRNFLLLLQHKTVPLHKARTPIKICFNVFTFAWICFCPFKCLSLYANSGNWIVITAVVIKPNFFVVFQFKPMRNACSWSIFLLRQFLHGSFISFQSHISYLAEVISFVTTFCLKLATYFICCPWNHEDKIFSATIFCNWISRMLNDNSNIYKNTCREGLP